MTRVRACLGVVLATVLLASASRAQESASTSPSESTADTGQPDTSATDEPEAGPLSFDITYYLYSDYIFRGINFSEYPGEGREALNHQITTSLGLDLAQLFGHEPGTWGNFSFDTFFEWYADQKALDPVHGGQNLQEVDYSLFWSYDIKPIATSLKLSYVFYTFPNAKPLNTQEWQVGLEHNDAWMWKWLLPGNEDGVLNPTVLFAQDVDEIQGWWAEIGISHGFEVVHGLTVTPSLLMAVDHDYLGPATGTNLSGSTKLAYLQWGLTADFDLSTIGKLPHDPGTWTLSTFLYYNQALGSAEKIAIQDEFYGGMSLGWSF